MIPPYERESLPQGYYSQSGTVLLRKDSSATGQSLLIFLRDLGPQWVSAPGAIGKKTRFGAATEPLVWGVFNLYQSPKKLYLQGVEIKEDFFCLRREPAKLLAAFRFYKRVRRVLFTEHESNQILVLLWNSMLLLAKDAPREALEFRFTWRLLRAAGMAPSLQVCSECSSRLDDGVFWTRDGLVCSKCKTGSEAISAQSLLLLQRAALLSGDQFAAWSKDKICDSDFFKEQTEKILTFFPDIN